jgi:hypothetical protein
MMEKVLLNLEVTREQRLVLKAAAAECDLRMSEIVRRGVSRVLSELRPERAAAWGGETPVTLAGG